MKAVLKVAMAIFMVLVAFWAASQAVKGTVRAGARSVSALQAFHSWLVPDICQAQHAAAAASCGAARAEYLEGYAAAQSNTHTSIPPEGISTSVDLWAIAQHLNISLAAAPGRTAFKPLERFRVSKKSSKQKMQPGEAAVLAALRLSELAATDPGIESAVAVMLAGTMDGVVKHLLASDTALQLHAVEAVSVLSRINGIARVALAATPGCIDALGQLLSSSNLTVQTKAAEALGNLAACQHGCCLLVGASPGVLQLLVSLLYSNHALVQESVAGALRNLAGNAVHALLVARIPGAEGRLGELIVGNSSDAVKVHAMWALADLAAHQQVLVCMRSAAAFPQLTQLQNSDNTELSRAASAALGNCSSDYASVISADTVAGAMGMVRGLLMASGLMFVGTVCVVVLTLMVNMGLIKRHGDHLYCGMHDLRSIDGPVELTFVK
jgi:hypothetical protein